LKTDISYIDADSFKVEDTDALKQNVIKFNNLIVQNHEELYYFYL